MKPINAYEEYVDKMTNFEQTKKIMREIDEYVWYNIPQGLTIDPARAKSNEVTFALVQVLVDKGLLTYDDFKGVLNGK